MAAERTFCLGCGTTFPADARFCGSCGSSRYPHPKSVSDGHVPEQQGTFGSGFWAGLTGKPRDPVSHAPTRTFTPRSAHENVRHDAEPQGLDGPPRNSPVGFRATSDVGRYSWLSGLLLLLIPISGLIADQIFRYPSYDWIKAIGVLIVPFAIFCWIFTTIRATHLLDVRFWFIPSTYVGLIGGVLTLLICLIMMVFSAESERRGHQTTDTTLYVAAAILYGGCVVWSYLYNWRKTGSAIVAVSLTLLQTISATFIIVALYLWIGGRNTKRYEREHGVT